MPLVGSRTLRALALLVLFCGSASWTYAVGWADDFNDGNITDGNPVTWNTNLLGAFPGNYNPTSGDLQLSAPGDPNGDQNPNNDQLVAWVNGVTMQDTYIRAQGVITPGPQPEQTGGNLALLARLDPSNVTGYVLYIDDGGQLGLQIAQGPNVVDIVPNVELGDINAASDVIIELNIVGEELRGFAWRPGQPKPETPQIVAIEPSFTSGRAGIAYDEDDDATTGVFRWAMAQDTPFIDTLAGDFNMDGSVDAADYVTWRDRLGNPFTPEDYNVWRANFGMGQAGGGSLSTGASVPEPTGLVLVLVALAGAVSFSRDRGARTSRRN